MYGKWALKRIQEHINILATPDSVRSDTAENMLNLLSGNAAMAEIGFNVASFLAQYPQSIASFMGEINIGRYLLAALDYLKAPKLFNETVREKSTVMRRRVFNYAKEYLQQMEKEGKLKGAQLTLAKAAMKMQEIADWQTVSIGWWAVYQKEVNSNGGNEEAAIAQADKVVLDTQPTMDETELPPYLRGGKGHLPKALVRYAVPLNVVWNQITYGIPFMIKNKGLGSAVSLYAGLAIANTIVAAMRGKLSDDDDDPVAAARKIAYYAVLSPVAESVPLVSDLVSWTAERVVTGKKIPLLQSKLYPMAETVGKAGVEWFEQNYQKAAWDSLIASLYAAGLPASQIKKIKTALEEGTFWPVIGFNTK
jgi:hypothetical protein